jgi:hypothetical protein
MLAEQELEQALSPDAAVAPKQIIYLFGAGATHAEADFQGADINLLMNNSKLFGDGVSTRILNAIGATAEFSTGDHNVDIEKLISLLTASGIAEHSSRAEQMREAYFTDVRNKLNEAGVMADPALAKGLLEMHKIEAFRENVERLAGIITTNHDGLLQVASQEIFGGLDLGFSFSSDDFADAADEHTPPILQLHGSFAWRFGVPLQASRLTVASEYHPDTVWIPPTILKEAKNYPFNKVTGFAYELLAKRCDVLRVVGASLTQNDWNILCLIFNAQRHKQSIGETAFEIELITPQSSCADIERDCPYLRRVIPIDQLKEGNMDVFQDPDLPPDSDPARNPFFYWLKEKINYHLNNNHFDEGSLGANMRRILGDNANGTNGRGLDH